MANITKDQIIEYVMHTPQNSNPYILRGMLDELESGGSGSSDFEIATLTVTNTSTDIDSVIIFYGLYIIENEMRMDMIEIYNNAPQNINVVLYKGTNSYCDFGHYDHGKEPILSGNIVFDGEHNSWIITGDCSFSADGISSEHGPK